MQINCSDVKYVLLETDIGGSRCYGIAAVIFTDTLHTVTDHIIDVYRDREHMLKVIDMCNEYKLDPVHLRDIVTDMLSGFDEMIV